MNTTASNARLHKMVGCALFAALTAVCSQLAIPMPWGVPINLALFAVYMAGTMLGPVWGAASQLVYLLLAIAAPWLSSAGAIALIGTIACLRGQCRLLGLAGLVLLLDLSGFYYALQWPLTNKALLLAGMGGGIAIALTALRHWHNRQPAASHKTSAHAACNGKQSSAPAIAANTAPNTSAAAPATTPEP